MAKKKRQTENGEFPTASMLVTEEGGEPVIYVVYDGVRIAKRGKPDTPQAKTWVPLVEGFRVIDKGGNHLEIHATGRLQ